MWMTFVLTLYIWATGIRQHADPASARDACSAFLATLDESARAKAAFPFDAPHRETWRYMPVPRLGLFIKDMTPEQRVAAHALLRSVLSAEGYLKAATIMSLERELHEMESTLERPAAHRDPLLYLVAIYGEPADGKPWFFRFEGHHLSVNVLFEGDRIVSTAPLFMGANPSEIRRGDRAGLRTLAGEERLARALLVSLTPEQRKTAIIEPRTPAGVRPIERSEIDRSGQRGLAASDMTEPQRQQLRALISLYFDALEPDAAASEKSRLAEAGEERVRFAWAGAVEPGGDHAYWIDGPTIVVEYNNAQDGANHIHVVRRDPERE